MSAPNDLVLVTSGGAAVSFKPSQFISAVGTLPATGVFVNINTTGNIIQVNVADATAQSAFVTAVYTAVNAYYTAVNA